MNPCVDFCWQRFGKEYSSDECDYSCDYAKALKENEKLRKKLKEIKMGSFSFMKADNLTEIANIVYDKPFKFLIPSPFAKGEFSKGYIKDKYQDYGYLDYKRDKDGNPTIQPRFDVHELLAIWNADKVIVKSYISPDGLYVLSERDFKNLDYLIESAKEFSQKGLNDDFTIKFLNLQKFKKEDFYLKEKVLSSYLIGNINNPMKEIDRYTVYNRNYGIELFFSERYKDPDIYQLKFVSRSYNHTYEECEGYSVNDPEQGYPAIKRKKL